MQNVNMMQLMQRCMARLEVDISSEERIKVLKVLASTATMLVENLETIVEVA